jgi:hypothetical protein
MNDADGCIYFDRPEPERIRPLLDALRALPPATPEEKERALRAVNGQKVWRGLTPVLRPMGRVKSASDSW